MCAEGVKIIIDRGSHRRWQGAIQPSLQDAIAEILIAECRCAGVVGHAAIIARVRRYESCNQPFFALRVIQPSVPISNTQRMISTMAGARIDGIDHAATTPWQK